jgi:sugar phosphate isomerase/epimerase
MEKAASIAKELAPKAKEKGVVLGLENTLSAEDNLFILEKAGNPPGLKVYYDIGNSTNYGYDVPAEIRRLKDRICQIHFKDYKSGLLGQGEVNMVAVAEAMADIRYEGWVVLETGSPLGKELTAAANAAYIRGLFARFA